MTEDEILKEITDRRTVSNPPFEVVDVTFSPAKLAAFLAKHLPALQAPEVAVRDGLERV